MDGAGVVALGLAASNEQGVNWLTCWYGVRSLGATIGAVPTSISWRISFDTVKMKGWMAKPAQLCSLFWLDPHY